MPCHARRASEASEAGHCFSHRYSKSVRECTGYAYIRVPAIITITVLYSISQNWWIPSGCHDEGEETSKGAMCCACGPIMRAQRSAFVRSTAVMPGYLSMDRPEEITGPVGS